MTEEQQARELLELKARHRDQLEALAGNYDELMAKRDALAKEVDELQAQLKRKAEAGSKDGSNTVTPTTAAPAAAAAPGHRRRWSGEQAAVAEGDQITMTDEQIADALSNLIDFSAKKSNIRTSNKNPTRV